MPNRRVRLRDALIGGLLAGLAFEAMKRGFAWYVAQFPTYKLVYGAFASVPLFLLWVYLSWFVVLCGAVLVAALPEWRTRSAEAPRVAGSDFFDALAILRVLFEAHRSGRVVRLPELHRAVAAPVERIESLLEAMVGAMWVSRTLPLGWVLNRDPEMIKISEVYRNFVFRGEVPAVVTSENAGDGRIAGKIRSAIEESSAISLEQFFGAEAAEPKQSPAAPQTT
jgi:membrane protein